MSKTIQMFMLEPGQGLVNNSEIFRINDFKCPACSGKGLQDYSGWSSKFKRNFDDPDEQPCERCGGSGKLTANVLVNWTPFKKIK